MTSIAKRKVAMTSGIANSYGGVDEGLKVYSIKIMTSLATTMDSELPREVCDTICSYLWDIPAIMDTTHGVQFYHRGQDLYIATYKPPIFKRRPPLPLSPAQMLLDSIAYGAVVTFYPETF
jgi:hypothetical protein